MSKLNLAACTLASALLATTAMAQTSPAPSTQAPAVAPSTVAPSTSGMMNNTTMNSTSAASTQFYTVMSANQWRASKFVGVDIYGATNEKIGDVNDIIIDGQGNINAVVIGVGGFLGIGEKDVAIPFRTVEWMMTDHNARSASTGALGTSNAPTANNNGAMGTNSTANSAANNAGSNAANRAANSADVTGTTVAGSTDNRAYPDHGVLRMTKQDLQNAPSFHYADSSNARNNNAPQNPVPTGTKP